MDELNLLAKAQDHLEELMQRLADRDEADLIADVAQPLMARLTGLLLGMPAETHPRLVHWSQATIRAAFDGPGEYADVLGEFDQCIARLVAERSGATGGDFVAAITRIGQATLPLEKVTSLARLLVTAGTETTIGLIGHAFINALREPDFFARHSMESHFVDEVTRYESPVQYLVRVTSRETRVRETAIRAGCPVVVLLASANSDEKVCPNPDSFDPQGHRAFKHLGFGYGPHYCLGARLARDVTQSALLALSALHQQRSIRIKQPIEYDRSEQLWRPLSIGVHLD